MREIVFGFALDQRGGRRLKADIPKLLGRTAWDPEVTLFAVGATRAYGARVAQHLDLVLSEHEDRAFEDGEHKIRPLVEVRRQDVFVIHSL